MTTAIARQEESPHARQREPAIDENAETRSIVAWPARPQQFPDLLTPLEAAQYLRLDELGTHSPISAVRTLNYWRDRGHLKATKYARHVWYRKAELDRFLAIMTED